MKLIICSVVATAILVLAPASARADLIHATINTSITLQGSDDNGFYTVDVFTGAISVGSGFSNTYNFFRQGTYGGFSTASNQLTGNIGLSINANSITITFNGQAQPVELIGSFTNLPGTVTSATERDSGFISGVALPLPNSFTTTSLTTGAFYLGFQPGTSTSQTNVLTFGSASVAEPSTLVLTGISLVCGIAMVWRKKCGGLEEAIPLA